jgi:hypothetical protein
MKIDEENRQTSAEFIPEFTGFETFFSVAAQS